jgi:FAS-associated factor 2
MTKITPCRFPSREGQERGEKTSALTRLLPRSATASCLLVFIPTTTAITAAFPNPQTLAPPPPVASPAAMAESIDDKVSYFQAVTGISDTDLCTEILAAHNWDLQLAVSSITANPSSPSASPREPAPSVPLADADLVAPPVPPPPPPQQYPPPHQKPGIAWKLVTLPFYVVSGGVGLIAGTVRLGAWVAGGVLSRSLSLFGLAAQGDGGDRLLELPPSAAEAADFLAEFQHEFGAGRGPRFVAEGFADALQRAQREYKLLFVYLHSPDHPDTSAFCGGCLCAEPVAAFIDENFVAWGGSIRRTEGFKMSNSLNASRFPFCAVVMASTNQRITLLQQVRLRVSLNLI